MGLILMEGFDRAAIMVDKWDIVGGSGWTTGAGRADGGHALVNTIASANVTKNLDRSPQLLATGQIDGLVVGYAFKGAGTVSVLSDGIFLRDTLLSFAPDLNGNLHVFLGTATEANSVFASDVPTQLYAGVWSYVEFKILFATGDVSLRINGADAGSVNVGALAQPGAVFIDGAGATAWDDIYILDTYGAAPFNDFLGDVRVIATAPTFDVQKEFTPLTGTDNFAMVDEGWPGPDEDASYNVADLAGKRDLFGIAASGLSADDYEFLGGQVVVRAKKEDSGTRLFRLVCRSGAAVAVSDTYALPADYVTLVAFFAVDPATGLAWTQEAWEAAAIGYETVAAA